MADTRAALLRARDTFWFLPAVLGLAAVALAQGLITFDRRLSNTDFGAWGALFYRVGASGSRDILGAIGGSMLGVAATSFSITISVLATASSTYGPRLVRNFMADRGNQFVLGMFGATFLYALMVLRSIRSAADDHIAFVPDIAVNVAVLLAVVDVAVLVYFIHHIANSIQVSTLSARVRRELVDAVDMLYPAEQPDNAVAAPALDAVSLSTVVAKSSGFVVSIDESALLEAARRHDCVCELRVRSGHHLVAGEIIAVVSSSEMADDVRSAVRLGDSRTPRQDITFATQQLTEMAVRALSASTNDPYTARNALDELAVGLVPLSRRPVPLTGRTDDEGVPRLTVTRVPVVELLDDVFDAIRVCVADDPIAVEAVIRLARRIGLATVHDDIRECVQEKLRALRRAVEASSPDPSDLDRCARHVDEALESMA
ncbi:hypothetical protein GCM10007304_09510 [Rhodococcoides trifolii]|uniref:DUF2254 domain-containing protein n=1 Tax=Rhodococcoides trifolii TaxID=908250 RepID=A0A917FQI4_9NOCA|nr:DUF2254 domain-containing protein [Rhodococcus trifolii]GGF97688.1 hypothetical protein GCM10007304_09510 [Rhodococcus trifolii]